MTMKLATIFGGAALLALAACSSEPDEPETQANTTVEVPEVEDVTPETSAPPPAPAANSVDNLSANVAEALEEEPVAPDQQVLDDAEATGMTARLPAQGEDAPADGGGAQ